MALLECLLFQFWLLAPLVRVQYLQVVRYLLRLGALYCLLLDLVQLTFLPAWNMTNLVKMPMTHTGIPITIQPFCNQCKKIRGGSPLIFLH